MEKGTFFEKNVLKILHTPPPSPPFYSIPFPSFLHQNKALHNFRKRGKRSTLERNMGLEYAMPYVTVQFEKVYNCH